MRCQTGQYQSVVETRRSDAPVCHDRFSVVVWGRGIEEGRGGLVPEHTRTLLPKPEAPQMRSITSCSSINATMIAHIWYGWTTLDNADKYGRR